MTDPSSHQVQGQVERAQRLRAQIERLKGAPDEKVSGSEGSLREQIEQRAAEYEKRSERKRRKKT